MDASRVLKILSLSFSYSNIPRNIRIQYNNLANGNPWSLRPSFLFRE